MPRHLWLLVLLQFLLLPTAAHAQARGDVGLAMGVPADISFIWHASDAVAVRPELSFAHSSSETDTSIAGAPSSSDGWSVGVGVSGLWYISRTENVRTYVSPRVAYGRSRNNVVEGSVGASTRNTVSASGSFGAQYLPVAKFGVFGEVGYGVSRGSTSLEAPVSSSKVTGWSWATRGAVGVIFYFRNR